MSGLSHAQRAKRAAKLREHYPPESPQAAALAEYILAVRDAEGAQERAEQAWAKYLGSFRKREANS